MPYMKSKNPYLLALILVTSLFFLWGLTYGLLDVLNKHFQETLNITRQRSTLLQLAYFGAYFTIALPAGLFMKKAGYRKGIIFGLLLFALGASLFYPAAEMSSFTFFLLAIFILASGITFLETAANPYVTVLGDPKTSTFRLNLSQSFNGVGSFVGPIIGGSLFFGSEKTAEGNNLESVQLVYVLIAIVVLIVALIFFRTPMPEVKEEEKVESKEMQSETRLFQHSNFKHAVVAQFFYVAAQVGIAALFINYCTEKGLGISNQDASYLLFISLLLFTIGRFTGTAIMRAVPANKLLGIYAIINIVLCVIVVWGSGKISIGSLMAIFFFESIMFPTIFALGVKDLGKHTKNGSSFIIMSIVGGALVPVVMGYLADHYSTPTAFIVPLICFVIVVFFAFSGYRVKISS